MPQVREPESDELFDIGKAGSTRSNWAKPWSGSPRLSPVAPPCRKRPPSPTSLSSTRRRTANCRSRIDRHDPAADGI